MDIYDHVGTYRRPVDPIVAAERAVIEAADAWCDTGYAIPRLRRAVRELRRLRAAQATQVSA